MNAKLLLAAALLLATVAAAEGFMRHVKKHHHRDSNRSQLEKDCDKAVKANCEKRGTNREECKEHCDCGVQIPECAELGENIGFTVDDCYEKCNHAFQPSKEETTNLSQLEKDCDLAAKANCEKHTTYEQCKENCDCVVQIPECAEVWVEAKGLTVDDCYKNFCYAKYSESRHHHRRH